MLKHVFAAAMIAALSLAPVRAATEAIPMKEDGGVYVVPVTLDSIVTLDCIVDSGASDMSIPESVFRRLVRAGAVTDADFVGTRQYMLADGSSKRGEVFRIRALKVGSIVVKDVVASIGGSQSSGLLGQSFLSRFKSWSVDNGQHALMLVGPPSAPAPIPHPVTAGGGSEEPDGKTVAQVPNHHGDDHTPPPSPNGRSQSQTPAGDDGAPLAAQGGH
jgi:clan AA aspartic protease (TIGR02281 family)